MTRALLGVVTLAVVRWTFAASARDDTLAEAIAAQRTALVEEIGKLRTETVRLSVQLEGFDRDIVEARATVRAVGLLRGSHEELGRRVRTLEDRIEELVRLRVAPDRASPDRDD